MESILTFAGAALYAIAAVLAVSSLVRPGERRERSALILMAAGALPLLAVLVMRGCRAGCIPSLSRYDALTCYVLATTVVYLLTMASHYTRGIAGILIPYLTAVLLCAMPAMQMKAGPPPPIQCPWLALHVIAGFAAYAVFSVASVFAAAYLVQDRNMKRRHLGTLWERLPSLEILDYLMGFLVGVGFLLFSVSIAIGFLLVHRTAGGNEWFTDPKVMATAAAWSLFAVLVHMRASADRHGRNVAIVTVAGVICISIAFIGVPLLANSLHAFLKIRAGVN